MRRKGSIEKTKHSSGGAGAVSQATPYKHINTLTSLSWDRMCRKQEDPKSYEEEQSVRGLAPETQVSLSRYSVTIKLCDSYCLGICLNELVIW